MIWIKKEIGQKSLR